MDEGKSSRFAVSLIVVVSILILIVALSSLVAYLELSPISSESSQTFTTYFHYSISINYSSSWNLVYWGHDGTGTQINVRGNFNGSGNYETEVTTYGVGYVENTLCSNATKLDSQNNLTLTLTVITFTNSTNAYDPSVEVCATQAV